MEPITAEIPVLAELDLHRSDDKFQRHLEELIRQKQEDDINREQFQAGVELILEAFGDIRVQIGDEEASMQSVEATLPQDYADDMGFEICPKCKGLVHVPGEDLCFVCRGE